MSVSRLVQAMIMPLKSAAPVAVTEGSIYLGRYGLRYDHYWMVANEDDGVFCSQRESPKMALIGCRLLQENGSLEIQVPGAPSMLLPLIGGDGPRCFVSVHGTKMIAMDQGAYAPDLAPAISDLLDKRVRVVRVAPEDERRTKTGRDIAFQDGWQVLGASMASLDAVNGWLREEGHPGPVDMRRFRPQLIFDGCEPFAEDRWREIWIGRSLFRGEEHCYRCPIPDVNPDTGGRGKGVAKVLLDHRKRSEADPKTGKTKNKVFFGRNLSIKQGVSVKIGEVVMVTEKDGGLTFDSP